MKEHLFQPFGSNLCGQTCVAMLTETNLEDAILLVGKKGLTRAKDLVQALQKKGFLTCGPVVLHGKSLPENAILNVHWRGRSTGHWMVRWQGNTYDPDPRGEREFVIPGCDAFLSGRVTSYIELEKL